VSDVKEKVDDIADKVKEKVGGKDDDDKEETDRTT
jgi:hypothetical protein